MPITRRVESDYKLKVKYGTWDQYKRQGSVDPSTLYFITDKGGAIYKGGESVYPRNVIERFEDQTVTVALSSGDTTGYSVSPGPLNRVMYNFEMELFDTGDEGTPNAPGEPNYIKFQVYSVEAVNAIRGVLMAALNQHQTWTSGGQTITSYGMGTNQRFGHVELTDNVDMTGVVLPESTSGGTAVTPKGVYDAIKAAISGMSGAMVFKGTIGASAPPATVTSLPTQGYHIGWTYKVVTAGTYAGYECGVGDLIIAVNNGPETGSTVINADWTVSQSDMQDVVTSNSTLTQNYLVVGRDGQRDVKTFLNGSEGQFLTTGASGLEWFTHSVINHGLCKFTCDTASSASTKVVSLPSGYNLQLGSIAAVTFTNAVDPELQSSNPVYFQIGASGTPYQIYYRGSGIGDNVIASGDTATMIYNGVWNVLSVDKQLSDVAYSNNYDDLLNKGVHYYVDSNSQGTTSRTITATDFTINSVRVVCVKFTYGVTAANATLNIGNTGDYNIKWRGSNIGASDIASGDTVTMIFDGSAFHIASIDRKFDSSPTNGSNNFVTSSAVYNAIENASLYWEQITS